MRGEKTDVNDKLKEKLVELYEHIKNNGELKFIFLSLCQYTGRADDNITTFIKKQGGRTSFEVIDIQRLKIDYIDRVYKKIDPINPLENYYNPEESPITIDIQRLNADGGNHIKIDRPFEAYVFLIRPQAIYDLFDKYGFSLFYKNVRNPLLQSNYNEEIKRTAQDNPAYFWYYNNGITAITYLLPEIREQAERIELTGLQIINGAQTVYSIYQAYKEASPTQRKRMDSEAIVNLRLLKSGGKDFDLNVTRYTNSQNPVNDRDFCANDDIQLALQNASYQTNVWYEKRRGEFRERPEGIKRVPNYVFANVYLAYHLQDPVSVLENYHQRKQSRKDLNFISDRNHKDGLYEEIFNANTKFNDMLSAFYVFDAIYKTSSAPYEVTFNTDLYHRLAWFKIVLYKFLVKKYKNKNMDINHYIIKNHGHDLDELIIKIFKFIGQFVEKNIGTSTQNLNGDWPDFFLNMASFIKMKKSLEKIEISVDDIESIIIDENEKMFKGGKASDTEEFGE